MKIGFLAMTQWFRLDNGSLMRHWPRRLLPQGRQEWTSTMTSANYALVRFFGSSRPNASSALFCSCCMPPGPQASKCGRHHADRLGALMTVVSEVPRLRDATHRRPIVYRPWARFRGQ